jgi:hypothetical protein
MSAQPLNYYDVGPYTSTKNGEAIGAIGAVHTVEYTFAVDDLPTTTGLGGTAITIPAGSVIEEFDLIVLTNLSGGTNITVGLSQPDGTVIDADGLLGASTATTGVVAGTGALVGTRLATQAQLTVATSRTAGVVKAIVKYSQY